MPKLMRLNVVPKAITDSSYKASIEMVTGDLSDETKLISARTKAIDFFKSTYAVTEEQVLKAIGLRSVNQIGKEQIADLRGMMQSLKDGDTTPEEIFGEKIPTPEIVKSKKQGEDSTLNV